VKHRPEDAPLADEAGAPAQEERADNMGGFVGFMESAFGRLLRIVAGIALIAVGLLVVPGTWGYVWGYVLAAVGVVFFFVGALGVCLLAPLFGYTLQGAPRHVRADS
jgi:hypothetical protein